jgi:type VI secretion system protein VasD
MLSPIIRAVFLINLVFMLASCSLLPQSLLPDHNVVVLLKADSVLNPNSQGRPTPLAVYFFQLKDVKAFNGADFFSLYNNAQATLGADYVAQTKIEVIPNAEGRLTFVAQPGVQYIGVFAVYYNQQVQWRYVYPLQTTWGDETLRVQFTRNGIQIHVPKGSGLDINALQQEGQNQLQSAQAQYGAASKQAQDRANGLLQPASGDANAQYESSTG